MELRKRTEQWEDDRLSKYATRSAASRGRGVPEEPCPVRTCFQRDRDRIIHSKAFRRLKHKTQVFIIPEGDHFRTRLTHTLEVAQIARTVARALALNEDLTEAIALGHDLGHTPFGHAGEDVLDEVHPGGFRHNEQSLRVVDVLEREGGLNLTWEVRDGILNHCGGLQPATLEGEVVHFSDRIAYINHDIDDAIRGNLLRLEDFPPGLLDKVGYRHSRRIHNMVLDLVEQSWGKPHISLSAEMQSVVNNLREFLFEKVYVGSAAKKEERKAKNMIKQLYEFYLSNPGEMYEGGGPPPGEEPGRAACDYIAGMTDRFAVAQFRKFFVPEPWRLEP
ncbi:MAG: deoxyguanosinetriphosphate triphosphohydrolase [Firmicutes bacterium]|jgi:dGTPase|nr:deoxyguanosinetriphosphate triphosphohydrolase [Bacillota bacterium]